MLYKLQVAKIGSAEHRKGNKTAPGKVATTRTEDGHRLPKQALQYQPKDEGTKDDRGRDRGANFILRIKEQETCLTLLEHDDGDEVTSCCLF